MKLSDFWYRYAILSRVVCCVQCLMGGTDIDSGGTYRKNLANAVQDGELDIKYRPPTYPPLDTYHPDILHVFCNSI
eukprot:COSAG05_NODE_752_length_7532_cov_44.503565_6_plen_76_part_00